MNLVERLLQSDGNIEKATKTIRSKRLGRLTGNPYEEVTIQEISGRRFNDVKARLSGGGDKEYEANLLCCTLGVKNPDLRSPELMKRFGVNTPKDLCEKLFSGEAYAIAAEIIDISGFTLDENAEEEGIKN